MKKFIFTLLGFFFILTITLNTASTLKANAYSYSQNNTYLRVITEDTPFYSDSNCLNLLFYLPYTYYVKVLGYENDVAHVECYGTQNSIALDGYVPVQMLFLDGLEVLNPYLNKTITTLSTTLLYLDLDGKQAIQYLFNNRQLTYYGLAFANDNSVMFYVGYNSKLGYVKESDVMPFTITNHPNELTFLIPETPPEQPSVESQNTTTTSVLKIVIFSCLLLAGIVALFIAVKNKQPSHVASSYYDENDYE